MRDMVVLRVLQDTLIEKGAVNPRFRALSAGDRPETDFSIDMFREVKVERRLKDGFAGDEVGVLVFELGFAHDDGNAVLVWSNEQKLVVSK